MDKKETLIVVAVFLAVFIVAFAFSFFVKSQNVSLLEYRIIASKPPLEALKSVLDQNRSLVLKQELTEGATRENSAVAAASSELIYAALVTGTKIYNYGSINGTNLNSSCNANNSFCGQPDIVVGVDNSQEPCNCIIVNDNRTMEIRGSVQFLLKKAVNLRNIVYYARSK
ncbi:MAG: hypothetical protein V1644_02235 [Candidatus Micrarchaeota archaeon]